MARQAKLRVRVQIDAIEVDTEAGAGSKPKILEHILAYEHEFESGTTDFTQLDRLWSTAAGATTTPTDLDLVGTNNLPSKLDTGLNCNFTDFCVLAVANDEVSGSASINVGAGSNPLDGVWLAAGDGAKVYPKGILLWVAPGGVQPTAGTADVLRLVASTGTVAGRALIAGRSL